MREKTIDGLLAEIEELKAWKHAAITEHVKWLEWAAKLLYGKTQTGDSLFESTVKYVDELKTRLEKAEYSANGFESLYDAAHAENEQLKSRIATVLDTILRFGGIDGDHHKAWVIDQTVRALTGDGYDKWVDDYKGATDTDGEREYDWDEGIAP